MAAAYERMSGGFYGFFYADTKMGTTLCAFDPSGCGYAAFEDGRPRLTSRKPGGTHVGDGGHIQQSWAAAPKGPVIEFALTSHINFSFENRQHISVQLSCQVRGRHFVRLHSSHADSQPCFVAQGLTEQYDLGELQQCSTDSYLQKSVGVIKHGPERGKQV